MKITNFSTNYSFLSSFVSKFLYAIKNLPVNFPVKSSQVIERDFEVAEKLVNAPAAKLDLLWSRKTLF
jgi:hypothetical protein